MLDSEDDQIHLSHQLAAQAHFEVCMGELLKRTEMDVARSAYHGIDVAGLCVQFFNRLGIGDVDLKVATLPADADDLVPGRKRAIDGFAKCAGRSDENDPHDDLR